MAGFELSGGDVRVKTLSAGSASTTEVVADVKTVLKLTKEKDGQWRVAEVRTGPNHWEEIDLIGSALGVDRPPSDCFTPDPPFRGSLAVDPSAKRARCLLGSLFDIEVPSDDIRIQTISPLAIPFASQPSALVVAWIRVVARIVNQGKGWLVAEVRTGNREWVQLSSLVAAINSRKAERAREELEFMAVALEQFRRDRGSYIVSNDHAVVVDHLSPKYLSRIMRLDPWHQPYKYEGELGHFTLRSSGPDRKEGTADDISLAGSP